MIPDLPADLVASPWYEWLVLPLAIFFARTLDMSLSTLRISMIAQGRMLLAPLFGFFESLLWLLIIAQVLQHLDNPLCVIAYAGGFAAGSSAGLLLERRMAIGARILRIITLGPAAELASALRGAGVGVTVVDGHGAQGPVKILFSLVRRRDVERILELVREQDPSAFYSIEDVRQARDTIFPLLRARPEPRDWMLWRSLRKSK